MLSPYPIGPASARSVPMPLVSKDRDFLSLTTDSYRRNRNAAMKFGNVDLSEPMPIPRRDDPQDDHNSDKCEFCDIVTTDVDAVSSAHGNHLGRVGDVQQHTKGLSLSYNGGLSRKCRKCGSNMDGPEYTRAPVTSLLNRPVVGMGFSRIKVVDFFPENRWQCCQCGATVTVWDRRLLGTVNLLSCVLAAIMAYSVSSKAAMFVFAAGLVAFPIAYYVFQRIRYPFVKRDVR